MSTYFDSRCDKGLAENLAGFRQQIQLQSYLPTNSASYVRCRYQSWLSILV